MVAGWCKVIKTDCGDMLAVKDQNEQEQPTINMVCRMEDVGEVSHTITFNKVKARDNTFNGMDEGTALAVFRTTVEDINELTGANYGTIKKS